jgi:hypothetical protein
VKMMVRLTIFPSRMGIHVNWAPADPAELLELGEPSEEERRFLADLGHSSHAEGGYASASSRFPADNVAVSERWARTRYTDLRYHPTPGRGGHFAAYEAPGEFTAEVRTGLRALV